MVIAALGSSSPFRQNFFVASVVVLFWKVGHEHCGSFQRDLSRKCSPIHTSIFEEKKLLLYACKFDLEVHLHGFILNFSVFQHLLRTHFLKRIFTMGITCGMEFLEDYGIFNALDYILQGQFNMYVVTELKQLFVHFQPSLHWQQIPMYFPSSTFLVIISPGSCAFTYQAVTWTGADSGSIFCIVSSILSRYSAANVVAQPFSITVVRTSLHRMCSRV